MIVEATTAKSCRTRTGRVLSFPKEAGDCMTYQLGQKSQKNLQGVHPDLMKVVQRAIIITDQDFAVHEGMRTLQRQKMLFATKASKTMQSRHLTGHAVDLVPYVDGSLRWEWPLIFSIACAVDAAAAAFDVPIRWGGVWDKLMSEYGGSPQAMEKAVADYCARHPGPDFIDGPHFELPRSIYP